MKLNENGQIIFFVKMLFINC